MALSTWLDATMQSLATDGLVPCGTLNARWNADRQVSVVTWSDGSRTVYLGEAPVQGKRRAVYSVVNDAKVIATIRRLEAGAAKHAATMADSDEDDLYRAAAELGIDLAR